MAPCRVTALVFLAAMQVGWLSGRAHAYDQTAFARTLADPVEQGHILGAAKRSQVVISNPCPAARFTLLDQVSIQKPPEFDGAGLMTAGAWRQVVTAEGCGASRKLNVLAWVGSPGSLHTMPLLPGSTRADPLLQRDAARIAFAAVGAEKNCSIGYIEDTAFRALAPTAIAGGRSPPWTEIWTLVSCTKRSAVTVQFTPDSTGTGIVASDVKASDVKATKLPPAP